MMPHWENLAQMFVARSLNSIPQGILIAGFTWLILRLLPRQNSKTRFAVWFIALLAIVTLPIAGTFATGSSFKGSRASQPLLNLPDHWALTFFVIWLVTASVAVLRLAFGIWRLRGLLRSCIPVSPAELDPTVAAFVLSHSVTLATSKKMNVPAAIGFREPMIVVPRWALTELAPQELTSVLLHEYAHLERRDGWTNLLQKTVRAIFCFHPVVWWIEHRLSLEREMACDDYVLAQTNDPHGYGRCLIGILERTLPRKAWTMAQAAVHRAHEATLRLTQILDRDRSTSKRLWKPALGVVSTFSLLSILILPQTRQLVGFAPDRQATAHASAALPQISTSPIVSAAVVPAALHSTRLPVEQRLEPKGPQKRVVSPPKQLRQMDNSALIARAKSAAIPADVVPVNVNADEMAIPATQAILVIRTANQVGPNTWRWSIAVWQVSIAPDRSQRVPVVSNKT